MKHVCTAIALLIFFMPSMVTAKTIVISLERDIHDYAVDLLAGKPFSDVQPIDFKHPACLRDIVELVIAQKALALGGFTHKIEFELGNYDARNLKLLRHGLLLVSFDTIWHEQIKQFDEQLFISQPMIKKGQYFAGIYTAPENISRITKLIDNDFSQVSIVTSSVWYADWKTIQLLKPLKITDESDWISMAKMVSKGWVDIMLAPFTLKAPFEYQGDNYHIRAIPNIKVPLQDSRHFVVSKRHPMGEETFQALEKGLKILQSQGFIEASYKYCGFINQSTDNWKEITY